MANPTRSLNERVNWITFFSALGIELPAAILPATLTCPLCEAERFVVCEDRVVGGQWAYCRDCRFAGDMIELSARVWSLDAVSALERLSSLELLKGCLTPEGIEGYVRDHLQYRARLDAFWKDSQERPVHYGDVELLQHFGLWDQIHCRSLWLERSGRFVGSAEYRSVQELFAPASYAPQLRKNHRTHSVRRGAGPGKYRLFPGTNWGEVLVVPYQDLPGRICGFLFIGRNAEHPAGVTVFKSANFQPTSIPVREAGLAMWAAMEEPRQERLFNGEDVLFVVADPLLALQLQFHWLRVSSRPLPIVATYRDPRVRTAAALAHLPAKKVIFWGNDAESLRQAKTADAELSRHTITATEVQKSRADCPPCDWLRLCRTHAKPWRVAFHDLLRECDLPTVEATFRTLNFTPHEIRNLLPTIEESLREKLARMESLTLASRKVVVRGKTIVESDAGWTLESSGELISDAAIRVEEVLRTGEGTTYYRGMIRRGATQHPFTAPQADVDRRGLFLVSRDELLKRGAGLLSFQPRWAAHALFIAQALGQPQCREGVDRIGWNPREYCFVFPQFRIFRGGEIRTDAPPLAIENPPAARFGRSPNSLTAEQVAALGAKRPEVPIFWAVAACVIHNLLAPAMRSPPAGILLDGQGAVVTGPAVAKAMGCLEIELRQRLTGERVRARLDEAVGRHDWPVILKQSSGHATRITVAWAESAGPKNAILSLGPYATLSLATNRGFHLISAHEPAAPLGVLQEIAGDMLFGYFRDVCNRCLRIDGGTGAQVLDVLHDMANWFERQEGNPKAVLRAEQVLQPGDEKQAGRLFIELVFRLYDSGRIKMDLDGFRKRAPKGCVGRPEIVVRPISPSVAAADGTRKALWLPVREISRLLGQQGAPAVNLERVAASLRGGAGFVGEEGDGWLFDAKWWANHYQIRPREKWSA